MEQIDTLATQSDGLFPTDMARGVGPITPENHRDFIDRLLLLTSEVIHLRAKHSFEDFYEAVVACLDEARDTF